MRDLHLAHRLNTTTPERTNGIDKNLSSNQTVFQGARGKIVDYLNYEDHVIELVSGILNHSTQRRFVIDNLSQLKNLFYLDVPQKFRPYLFGQLNSLIGRFMLDYRSDAIVYQACYTMMTAFKGQIDRAPQVDDELSDLEWQELEKSVYLLTEWEDFTNSVPFEELRIVGS